MVGIWTGISLLLGLIGAVGVLYSWLRRPEVSVSEISARFDNPPVMGGTILKQRNNLPVVPVIPAVFGSVVVEVDDGTLSESLKSWQCDISVKKARKLF